MGDGDVATRMRVLAGQFAGAHQELDFSLGSLSVFEEIIIAERASRTNALPLWGAYLGETVIRACGPELCWTDFATAARLLPPVAAVEPAEETAVVLTAGSACWFPLVKINKFLDHGRQDSPAAFAAPVLISALRTPAERTTALEIVQQIAARLHADITPMLDPLLEVLDNGKPAHAELVLMALKSQAFGIRHGRVPFDPRVAEAIPLIVRHTAALPGKSKTTRVQIAAHYALSAYRTLDEHLTAAQLTAIEQASAATSHMR